jgi:hypothetical protein
VTALSTINPDGYYIVPSTIDIDGLTLTPSKTGLLKETHRKFEQLHFSYVAQRETFRDAITFKQLLLTMILRYRGSSSSSPDLRLPTVVMCGC